MVARRLKVIAQGGQDSTRKERLVFDLQSGQLTVKSGPKCNEHSSKKELDYIIKLYQFCFDYKEYTVLICFIIEFYAPIFMCYCSQFQSLT